MRLLEVKAHGEFSLTTDLFDDIPPYAILSHTWGSDADEVTFKDLTDGTGHSKVGYNKIRFCGEQAKYDSLRYFWVDTCCIDKSNHNDLSEAINSMFRWYREAEKCYVYLSDVSTPNRPSNFEWKSAFRKSRWFTRGWTLQELIAPVSVDFFSKEGERLGNKTSLGQEIHEITGIPLTAFQGGSLFDFSVPERLSWVQNRNTKRREDKAYSLLGIFDVYMPLIYGEGVENAFRRLQEEVVKRSSHDRGIFSMPEDSAQDDTAALLQTERTKLVLHGNRLPKVVATSSAGFGTDASNGNSRKRKRDQYLASASTEKPRLDEGTSHPLAASLPARSRIQQLRAAIHSEMRQQTNTYVYPPLKEGDGQVTRVLVIEPGEGDDPIKCRLVPSALPKFTPLKTKAYPYTALSYYWGEGDPIHPITVTNYSTPTKRMKEPSTPVERSIFIWRKHKVWKESGKVYVRSNLYAALQRFRNKKKKRIMWIDALCIDQKDNYERSMQVRQMHEIYSQAKNVSIWLSDDNTRDCFGFLRKILDLGNLDILLDDLTDGGYNMEARQVVQLMCNKWFTRRWVIQELAFARKAKVVYGKQTMPWSDFANALAIFVNSQVLLGPVMSKMIADETSSTTVKHLGANVLVNCINNLFRLDENGDIKQRMMSLEDLVCSFLGFETTDAKDTIYAVLSLAKDTQDTLDERVIPAYHHSLLDVYIDFIDFCIDKSQSLDILLCHWALSPRMERHTTLFLNPGSSIWLEELPTWFPLIEKSSYGTLSQAIRGRLNGDSFVGTSIPSSQRNYNATLDLQPQKEFQRKVYPEETHGREQRKKYNGRLIIQGLRIGKVKKTSPRATKATVFKEAFELAGFNHEWWQKYQEWAIDMPCIPEGVWRTMIADRGPNGTNPPSWYPQAFSECLNNLTPNGDLIPDDVIDLPKASSIVKLFLKRVKDVIWERSFVRIKLDSQDKKTTYGLAPKETMEGDIVCVFFGCSVPVVLRQHGSGNKKYFQMIGECFVYGMMDGEAVAGTKWALPYRDAARFEIL